MKEWSGTKKVDLTLKEKQREGRSGNLALKESAQGRARTMPAVFLHLPLAIDSAVSPWSPNSYVDDLTPNVMMFEDGAFERQF